MKRILICLTCAAALALTLPVGVEAVGDEFKRESTETLLLDQGRYAEVGEGTGTVSPDLRHVAVAVREKGEWLVVVDGRVQERYAGIGQNTLKFSEDGSAVCYMAVKGGDRYMVFNGRELGPYDGVGESAMSADGRHLAFKVLKGDRYYVVFDGREFPPEGVKGGISYLHLSRDGSRMAFMIPYEGGSAIILDGEQGPVFKEMSPPVFSNDSAHLAYIVQSEGEAPRVFLDGQLGPPCEEMASFPIFSPGGGRMAYFVKEDRKTCLVMGTKKGSAYDFIPSETFTFNSDGTRYAYVAIDKNKQFMVVDGMPEKEYGAHSNPVFSPDGKHLAYAASRKKNSSCAVLDGEELSEIYDSVMDVTFSPDSQRLAYVATAKKKMFAIVNGQKSKPYEEVGSLVFGPDSSHLAFLASDRKKMLIVVNGVEGKRYDAILKPPTPKGKASRNVLFDGPDSFHYLAVEGKKILLVEERIVKTVPGS